MARSNFVDPDMVTIPISDGDYIVVKRRLTAGEQRRFYGRMVKTFMVGDKPELDPEKVGLTKVQEYLVDWGGPGFIRNGKPVELSEGAIGLLSPEKFAEIMQAIDTHEETQAAAMEAEKNGQGEASNSAATSPSAV